MPKRARGKTNRKNNRIGCSRAVVKRRDMSWVAAATRRSVVLLVSAAILVVNCTELGAPNTKGKKKRSRCHRALETILQKAGLGNHGDIIRSARRKLFCNSTTFKRPSGGLATRRVQGCKREPRDDDTWELNARPSGAQREQRLANHVGGVPVDLQGGAHKGDPLASNGTGGF